MQLAKFEYFVLTDDFDQLMRDEFYQAQEVLQGKTNLTEDVNRPNAEGDTPLHAACQNTSIRYIYLGETDISHDLKYLTKVLSGAHGP